MELSDDQKQMIRNMGALGYPAARMASVMGFDIEYTEDSMDDPDSEIYKIYQAGADHGQYMLDTKLFDLATEGNLAAMKELEIRKRKLKRK